MKKKITTIIFIILSVFVIGGCFSDGRHTAPTESVTSTNYPEQTTPIQVPEGVIADSVPERFAIYNQDIYCASSDSIFVLDTETNSLRILALADTPSSLTVIDNKLYYLSVAERDDDFSPISFCLNSLDLSTEEIVGLAYCEQGWYYIYDGLIYTAGDGGLYVQQMGEDEQNVVLIGLVNSPTGKGNRIYMSLEDDLAVYDIVDGKLTVLMKGVIPMNITPVEDGILYSDEISEYMYFYDFEKETSNQVDGIPNYGVSIYNGKYYYISNDDSSALYELERGGELKRILELGVLYDCSSPCFMEDRIYFIIHTEDYVGLVSYDETGEQTRFSEAAG